MTERQKSRKMDEIESGVYESLNNIYDIICPTTGCTYTIADVVSGTDMEMNSKQLNEAINAIYQKTPQFQPLIDRIRENTENKKKEDSIRRKKEYSKEYADKKKKKNPQISTIDREKQKQIERKERYRKVIELLIEEKYTYKEIVDISNRLYHIKVTESKIRDIKKEFIHNIDPWNKEEWNKPLKKLKLK